MPERIENKMVVDSAWHQPLDVMEKLNGAGRKEIGTGIFVPEEDAFEYALERISQDEREKEEFIDWFYSNGKWVGGLGSGANQNNGFCNYKGRAA